MFVIEILVCVLKCISRSARKNCVRATLWVCTFCHSCLHQTFFACFQQPFQRTFSSTLWTLATETWTKYYPICWQRTSPKVATGLKHQSTESPQILAEMEKTHHVSWRPYRRRMFEIACLYSLGNAGHRCCLSRRMINWLVGWTLWEIFSGLVAATVADNSIWGTVIGLIGVSVAFPITNEH